MFWCKIKFLPTSVEQKKLHYEQKVSTNSWLGMATIYIMAIFERHIDPVNLLLGMNISGMVLFKLVQKNSRCPPYLGGLP